MRQRTCAECGIGFYVSDYEGVNPDGDPVCDTCYRDWQEDEGNHRCDECGEWGPDDHVCGEYVFPVRPQPVFGGVAA